MKHVERIQFLKKILEEKPLTIHELATQVIEQLGNCSIRQIQRDLKDIHFVLNSNQELKNFRKNKIKYFYILVHKNQIEIKGVQKKYFNTNFYFQKKSKHIDFNLDIISVAINESKLIVISDIINDETGDNNNFETKNILLQPLEIIFHRDSYYVGGYNLNRKCVQIFGINQIKKIKLSNHFQSSSKIKELFHTELEKRFGITKNINENTYAIVLEISSVLAGFIKNHQWHASQKFSKKNGNIIMRLECGINRELLGWLFQWMYNIKIIEPPLLKDYYYKTLHEIMHVNQTKTPLVYKNIFLKN
ncbi:MAG: WYL domain-containing protein [Flavobacterium sp.]|nr:WYL domain-containing protein [Flavobacterium sp.]